MLVVVLIFFIAVILILHEDERTHRRDKTVLLNNIHVLQKRVEELEEELESSPKPTKGVTYV